MAKAAQLWEKIRAFVTKKLMNLVPHLIPVKRENMWTPGLTSPANEVCGFEVKRSTSYASPNGAVGCSAWLDRIGSKSPEAEVLEPSITRDPSVHTLVRHIEIIDAAIAEERATAPATLNNDWPLPALCNHEPARKSVDLNRMAFQVDPARVRIVISKRRGESSRCDERMNFYHGLKRLTRIRLHLAIYFLPLRGESD